MSIKNMSFSVAAKGYSAVKVVNCASRISGTRALKTFLEKNLERIHNLAIKSFIEYSPNSFTIETIEKRSSNVKELTLKISTDKLLSSGQRAYGTYRHKECEIELFAQQIKQDKTYRKIFDHVVDAKNSDKNKFIVASLAVYFHEYAHYLQGFSSMKVGEAYTREWHETHYEANAEFMSAVNLVQYFMPNLINKDKIEGLMKYSSFIDKIYTLSYEEYLQCSHLEIADAHNVFDHVMDYLTMPYSYIDKFLDSLAKGE